MIEKRADPRRHDAGSLGASPCLIPALAPRSTLLSHNVLRAIERALDSTRWRKEHSNCLYCCIGPAAGLPACHAHQEDAGTYAASTAIRRL